MNVIVAAAINTVERKNVCADNDGSITAVLNLRGTDVSAFHFTHSNRKHKKSGHNGENVKLKRKIDKRIYRLGVDQNSADINIGYTVSGKKWPPTTFVNNNFKS